MEKPLPLISMAPVAPVAPVTPVTPVSMAPIHTAVLHQYASDGNNNRLPIFKPNELKYFRFTPDQYILLEIEFNRYTIYKEINKSIEGIFKLSNGGNNTQSQDSIGRKIYENKNIIDRFVLECINHGISPHSQQLSLNTSIGTSVSMNIYEDIPTDTPEMDIINRQLLFNGVLADEARLLATPYFKKMISEYIEKKFRYTPDKAIQIARILVAANSRFAKAVTELYANRLRPGYFADIPCNLLVTSSENYIIRYRTYSKAVNFARYARLIRNYTRPFPFDILRMILRYAIFDLSNQQWSIGIALYDEIAQHLDVGFEMFASPLNFNMNMFCSLFLDTDKVFGSVGSFYNLTVDKLLNMGLRGVFYNPPYLPLLMETTTRMCIALLDKMLLLGVDFTIVSFLPNWVDADYILTFLDSRYTVFHRGIPKGQYVLHEKDKGKLIRGTFDLLFIVMNSRLSEWENTRKQSVNKICENIVQVMKTEIMEKNIEK